MRHDLLGLGSFRTEVLTTVNDVIADRGVPMVKTSRVIEALERGTGMGPGVIEDQVLEMALYWRSHVPLLHGKGNLGTPDDPPANPIYTEVRLSDAGTVALAAEDRHGVQLPLGLIEGSVARGGARPPYAPVGVLRAVRRAVEDRGAGDAELVEVVGPPSFPTRCRVEGDHEAIARGEAADLVLTAHVAVAAGEATADVILDRFPPGVSPHDAMADLLHLGNAWWTGPDRRELSRRAAEMAVTDIRQGPVGSVFVAFRGVDDVELLVDGLLRVDGVREPHFRCSLPAPLADLVRLAADQPAQPLLTALDAFEAMLPER